MEGSGLLQRVWLMGEVDGGQREGGKEESRGPGGVQSE